MKLVRNPLAKIRQAGGFATAQAAADKLGCSRVHLLNVERGRAGASWDLISKMMAAYGATETQIRVAVRKSRRELLRRMIEAA